ncbi:hypothetical protein BT96DRAFT_980734 [Gymnopus androsaceus JB14]|uniref:Uncharacterized protein n=1 Tax=Gymnopus androsaceus JB14 TaxID=1447944 RepID=A0A6A4GVK6_9AGAR|nr:hypothetical protein BT96DRAFT_980734 [Gymnopus androsaceus JB14]
MPDYVYALHDFTPENDDEIPFKAGERIEVLERDDAYGDGWWQVFSLKAILHPHRLPMEQKLLLTDNENPAASTSASLQPLEEEESEADSPSHPQPPAIFVNGNEADGEVMKATLTDVQKAIEQLGRNRASSVDGDGARSFSFASTRDDRDTDHESETDYDLSDTENQEFGDEAHHKTTRQRLAEKARKAVEEAEKLEMIMGGMNPGTRSSAPPIEVEMSDESEGEDDDHDDQDFTHTSSFLRRHSAIEEEDEDVETEGNGTAPTQTPQVHQDLTLPEQDVDETEAQTATAASFPSLPAPDNADSKSVSLPTPVSPSFLRSESTITPTPAAVLSVTPTPAASTPPPAVTPAAVRSPSPIRESLVALPSPSASSFNSNSGAFHFSPQRSQHNSLTSAPSSTPTVPPTEDGEAVSQPSQEKDDQKVSAKEKEKTHPSEWNVEEVVEWLRTKGFGDDVCDKFTEQEITGDVLLELDVNLLKNEIGIMAFGKRVRIANAITELRRPPSIGYDEQPMDLPPSPYVGPQTQRLMSQSPQLYAQSPHSINSQPYSQHTHSRTQSQSQSHHSYPGTATSVSGFRDSYGSNGVLMAAAGLMSPESPPQTADLPGSPRSEELFVDNSEKGLKGRPTQLTLSPSDGALNSSLKIVSGPQENEDDRAAMSDSEAPSTMTQSARRRIFGRSHDSSASKESRHSSSKDGASPSSSPIIAEKETKDSNDSKDKDDKEKEKDTKDGVTARTHTRARKSVDNGKSGDRLTSMGKSRKPPPRYSGFSTGPRKSNASSTTRPGSSSGLKEKEKEKEKDKSKDLLSPKGEKDGTGSTRDPALLRKRTSSSPGTIGSAESATKKTHTNGKASKANGHDNGPLSPLKPGQSILDQIGEPDHSGWMMKKGDRYNAWKQRYFVLKGPHMYCLKSDSHAETRIKGYINIIGYKVTVDENVNPGKYGSEEKSVIRDWMKGIMKATIGRDYTSTLTNLSSSSVNIPTIPLMVAQAMNPAPRPPSPTARDATQKAMRRENPNQLSSRDARVLMGLPTNAHHHLRDTASTDANKGPAPPRPSREARRTSVSQGLNVPIDDGLIEWANSHLPSSLQIKDTSGSICGGLTILRLAEAIKGRPSSPPVPDSAFPTDPGDDKLDGLFRLFDFLLDNDVKMGSGKRDKVVQLLKALKAWEDKRKAIAQSIGKGAMQAGGFIAPAYGLPVST